MTSKRILIVGGGFAGLYAAMEMERLADAGHDVTLVSAENFMQYQPFLPEVASGTIDPRAVVVPLRPVLKRATVDVGEVTAIDHEQRRVQVRIPDGTTVALGYDVLVVTAGSWSRVLPSPGLAEPVTLEFVGEVPADPAVRDAVKRRQLLTAQRGRQLLPHHLVAQQREQAQRQQEIHPRPGRQVPQPPLSRPGLLQHRVR